MASWADPAPPVAATSAAIEIGNTGKSAMRGYTPLITGSAADPGWILEIHGMWGAPTSRVKAA